MKKIILGIAIAIAATIGLLAGSANAEVLPTVDFESLTYTLGSINGQDGWSSLGAAGSGCAVYDHAASSSLGTTGFGAQSLRISNAVTSGCFGDQTFSKSLVNEVGETSATNATLSGGVRQNHFEMQFDIASTVPGAQQPGLFMSVSPDRGDGSRMSYVGFEDVVGGIDIIFYDVQGADNPANFVLTDLGTYDRSIKHSIKLTLDTVDGQSNDVVKVWIDGALANTGTSWENYFRFDPEALPEAGPRTVDSVLFRTGGTAVPTTAGKGFLVDNLNLTSLIPVAPSVPVITTPSNGAIVTVSAFNKVDWTDSTGGTPPVLYQYQAFSDAGYTSSLYDSGMTLSASEIPTLGTPPGDYYVRVRAQGSIGPESAWSNGVGSAYKITVVADPINPFDVPAQCDQSIAYNLIEGTDGSNVINGTNGPDLILAKGGSDKVDGKGGNDCIVGGAGSDKLIGGNGADVILGGDGSDSLEGNNDADKLYGEAASDSLKGGNGADQLFGGDGSDSLKGEAGADTLDGGNGIDSANGGPGNDTCTAEAQTQCSP